MSMKFANELLSLLHVQAADNLMVNLPLSLDARIMSELSRLNRHELRALPPGSFKAT